MAKKKTTKKRRAAPASSLTREFKATFAKAEQQASRERQRLQKTLGSLQQQRDGLDAKIEEVQARIDGIEGRLLRPWVKRQRAQESILGREQGG